MKRTCALFSSVACPALQYFFYMISLMARFSTKKLIKRIYILTFSTTLSETYLILRVRKNERDVIENVYWGFIQSPRYSCQILMNLEFSRKTFEKW